MCAFRHQSRRRRRCLPAAAATRQVVAVCHRPTTWMTMMTLLMAPQSGLMRLAAERRPDTIRPSCSSTRVCRDDALRCVRVTQVVHTCINKIARSRRRGRRRRTCALPRDRTKGDPKCHHLRCNETHVSEVVASVGATWRRIRVHCDMRASLAYFRYLLSSEDKAISDPGKHYTLGGS